MSSVNSHLSPVTCHLSPFTDSYSHRPSPCNILIESLYRQIHWKETYLYMCCFQVQSGNGRFTQSVHFKKTKKNTIMSMESTAVTKNIAGWSGWWKSGFYQTFIRSSRVKRRNFDPWFCKLSQKLIWSLLWQRGCSVWPAQPLIAT